MMRRRRLKRRQKGQAIVEYVILVVVIALAAFFVLAAFSTRLRDMITGTTVALGGEPADNADTSVEDLTKSLQADGTAN